MGQDPWPAWEEQPQTPWEGLTLLLCRDGFITLRGSWSTQRQCVWVQQCNLPQAQPCEVPCAEAPHTKAIPALRGPGPALRPPSLH